MRFTTKNCKLRNYRMIYIAAGIGTAIIAASIAGLVGMKGIAGSGNPEGISVAKNVLKEPQQPALEKELNVASLIASGAPFKGDRNAKVALVDFSDYQCANCRRFALQSEPQLINDYVNTGKVVLIFKHFPIFGPDSATAAMASMCAHDQGKFWEFHDRLYQNQGTENSGWANADNMKRSASDLGLDRKQFDSCLDGGKYKSYVESDLALAEKLGFPGTPSFVVMKSDGSNLQDMAGAQPYSSFKTVIAGKLAQA
jgi:protein-disulfide isomerase